MVYTPEPTGSPVASRALTYPPPQVLASIRQQNERHGTEVDHIVPVDYLNEEGDLLFTVQQELAAFKLTPETMDSGSETVRVSMVGGRSPMVITWAKK